MNRTKLSIFLVIICMILSFFGSTHTYATSTIDLSNAKSNVTSLVDVNDKNVTSVEAVDNNTTKITAHVNAYKAPLGEFSFSTNKSGVHTLDVTGVVGSMYPGQDLCFTLTNSKGENIRLAAYYDAATSKYVTYSDIADNRSTSIDVILDKDETYTLKLSEYKATPTSITGNYITENGAVISNDIDYLVTLEWNEEANSQVSYQSDIPANRVSNSDTGNIQGDLEETNERYELPDEQEVLLTDSDGHDGVNAVKEYLLNPLEETICDLCLAIGDFAIHLMNDIIGEDVTITNLIYNKVDAVNPNFFDQTVTGAGLTANIKSAINEWYNVFTSIAVAIYLVVFLSIGLNVLLASTSNGMEKAKTLFLDWAKGLFCLVFIPYIIKYAFLINETIVEMLADPAGAGKYQVGSTFGEKSEEWSAEAIEFRSPEFVSRYTGEVAFGSEDVTKSYVKKIAAYEQNLDLMRLMRAYAGATKKIVYVIIWYILFGQLIVFIVQYYKRYFMIAFLIVTFPLVCIFNSIATAQGRKGKEIGSWLKELLTNIFIQMIHAIIYSIITGICISIVKVDIKSSATLNWIIIILAINFISEGEKLLRKIIGSIGGGSTVGGMGSTATGVRGVGKQIKKGMQRITTGTEPKD